MEEHSVLQRDGADIHVGVDIPFTTAILGGSVEIPTINGNVSRGCIWCSSPWAGTADVKVPSGTQPNSRLMLRGKGAPDLNRRGQYGNEYVHLNVIIPDAADITPAQRRLLEDFIAQQRPQKSVVRKIKDFLKGV